MVFALLCCVFSLQEVCVFVCVFVVCVFVCVIKALFSFYFQRFEGCLANLDSDLSPLKSSTFQIGSWSHSGVIPLFFVMRHIINIFVMTQSFLHLTSSSTFGRRKKSTYSIHPSIYCNDYGLYVLWGQEQLVSLVNQYCLFTLRIRVS